MIRFASIQFAAIIYLQKISIGPQSLQLSLPMLIMVASIVWMLVRHKLSVSLPRFGFYLLFVACCLFSQTVVVGSGSLPSFIEIIVLYGYMVLSAPVPETTCLAILDRFIKLMIVPAGIMIFQYTYQKSTGSIDRST